MLNSVQVCTKKDQKSWLQGIYIMSSQDTVQNEGDIHYRQEAKKIGLLRLLCISSRNQIQISRLYAVCHILQCTFDA